MSVVSPFAAPREIADALNKLAAKFGAGTVTLGSATTTGIIDARLSPASVLTLQPVSSGGDAGNIVVQCGEGVATLTHGAGRSGQEYRFVIVNLSPGITSTQVVEPPTDPPTDPVVNDTPSTMTEPAVISPDVQSTSRVVLDQLITGESILRPLYWLGAKCDFAEGVAPDYPGAPVGSVPVGMLIQHEQYGGSVYNNASSIGLFSYGLNRAAGNNDCVAITGQGRKMDVANGIGDTAGIFGASWQDSNELGGVMGIEAAVYQNAPGNVLYSDRLGEKWSACLHITTTSVYSPASAGIAMDAIGTFEQNSYGVWAGLLIDANMFRGAGVAGTVGINCGSFGVGNQYPEYGIKIGACGNNHIYFNNQHGSMRANWGFFLEADGNNASDHYLNGIHMRIHDNHADAEFTVQRWNGTAWATVFSVGTWGTSIYDAGGLVIGEFRSSDRKLHLKNAAVVDL